MEKSLLLKISFIVTILGVLVLLIISNSINPVKLNIKQINSNYLDKKVQVQGEIINIKNYQESDFQVITLSDLTGEIQITLNKITSLQKNQKITVIGKITTYKNSLQIQADKIILN